MATVNYRFSGQKEGEHVLLLVRKHWLTFIGPFLFTFVVTVVPLLAWFFVFSRLDFLAIPDRFVYLGALVWGLGGSFFLLYNYLDWYLDIYLVTSLRIIDITQNGLFHRVVGETSLDNVQDVIYEVKGILPTIFNYGHVKIHTAGPSGDIVFEDVASPQKIQRFLLSETDAYKDVHTEKVATPEDLLHMMMAHEKERALKSPPQPDQLPSPAIPPSIAPPAPPPLSLPEQEET